MTGITKADLEQSVSDLLSGAYDRMNRDRFNRNAAYDTQTLKEVATPEGINVILHYRYNQPGLLDVLIAEAEQESENDQH